MLRFAPSCAFSILLAAPLAGQEVPVIDTEITWPTEVGGSGPFGKTIAVDVNGDLNRDLAVLRGGELFVYWGIGAYESLSKVPEASIDIDLLPPGEWGEMEQIVSVGPNGLYLIHQDRYTPSYEIASIGDQDWQGAQLVAVGNITEDETGKLEIVGVMSDGITVRSLEWAAGEWQEGIEFELPHQANAMAAFHWDDEEEDSEQELVFDTANGLYVFNDSADELLHVRHFEGPGELAVLPGEGEGDVDVVAWATSSLPGLQTDLLLEIEGTEVRTHLLPQQMRIIGLSTAIDLDGDEDLDLAISTSVDHEVWILRNQRNLPDPNAGFGLFSFESEIDDDPQIGTYRKIQVAPEGTPGKLSTNPVLAAFTWNETSLAVMVTATESLALEGDLLPTAVYSYGPDGYFEHFDPGFLEYCYAAPVSYLQMGLINQGPVGLDTTHLEVAIWVEPDGQAIEPGSISTCVLELGDGPLDDAYYDANADVLVFRVELLAGGLNFEDRYVVVARPVHVDPELYVTGPITIGVLAGGDQGEVVMAEGWVWEPVEFCNDGNSGFSGAFIEAERVPVFQHGQPPTLSFTCVNEQY